MNDIENILKNPHQKSTVNQILKDNNPEIPVDEELPIPARAKLPSIEPIKASTSKPIEMNQIPETEVPEVVVSEEIIIP